METYRTHRNQSGGFTLLETLITVAITVILLAFSVAGVARHRDNLKITELDNIARDIYMAAQNRAVLLHNSERLETELNGTSAAALALPTDISDITEGKSYIVWDGTNSGRWGELLPAGAIDPALREGRFYIVYEAPSGSVTDVFYSETDTIAGIEDAFKLAKQGRDARMRNDPMLGWFSGRAAEIAASPEPLDAPQVTVEIVNGEELTVKVTFAMPENLPAGATVTPTPSVRLEYDGVPLDLLDPQYNLRATFTGTIGTGTATCTWVLDSLLESDKQFKNLPGLSSNEPGGNFTVTAGLKLTADGYIPSAHYHSDTNNSLFAKGSADADAGAANIAYIENLRHLQNLHPGHSSVKTDITEAKQRNDIDCRGAEAADARYEFIPIENPNLHEYSGKNGDDNYHIDNLYIKRGVTDAGLFGKVASDLTITDCRVRWTRPEALVDGGDYAYAVSGENAGGLIGSVTGDPDEYDFIKVSIINSFAATTVKGADYAGGLVGSCVTSYDLSIENSYADCYLASAAGYCGGLVGEARADMGETIRLKNCYAAGFISAGVERACGLANSDYAAATNCYSAVRVLRAGGAVEKPGVLLFGLEMGESGSLRYLSDPAEAGAGTFGPSFEYDAGEPETGAYNLRFRLGSATELTGLYPYPGVKDTAGNTLPHYGDWGALSDPFPAGLVYYEKYSRAYNGQMYGMVGVFEDMELDTGLPGDTTVYADSDTQIVRDGYALAFVKGQEPDPKLSIIYAPRRAVPEGYVMPNAQEWTVRKNGNVWDWTQTDGGGGSHPGAAAFTVKVGGVDYTLIPLPDGIVNGNLPGYMKANQTLMHANFKQFFYQKLICGEAEDGEAVHTARTFWFNPHFAKTVLKPGASHAEPANNSSSAVRIRTPRNFYRLSTPSAVVRDGSGSIPLYYSGVSRVDDTSSGTKTTSINYFLQELDLDYAAYTEGYEGYFQPEAGSLPFYQDTIGFVSKNGGYLYGQYWAFKGTYNGGCHRIKNVYYNLKKLDVPGMQPMTASGGLFGLIKEAKLENIIYELNPEVPVMDRIFSESKGEFETTSEGTIAAGNTVTAGILVGTSYSGNLIKNCAVYGVNADYPDAQATVNNVLSELNGLPYCVGGLVGYNGSMCRIENCAAEVVSLRATYASVAGLVGTNAGVIDSCYAVGKIATEDSKSLSGLVGKNTGTVTNSYAAVNLSGGTTAKYGLSPNTVSSECRWLQGTFTYRGEEYIAGADYNQGGGSPVRVSALKGSLPALSRVDAANTVRYGIPAGTPWRGDYPAGTAFHYLSGVKRGASPAHYGLWPVNISLEAELVYWEGYSADGSSGDVTSYGLHFGAEDARSSLKDNKVIREDGYALAFERANAMASKYEIKYGAGNTRTWTLEKSGSGWQWKSGSTIRDTEVFTVDGKTVIPLPEAEVKANDLPVPDSFYQKLTVRPQVDSGEIIPGTYYFNPHFAKSVRTDETYATAKPNSDTPAYVRTPRHLYDLSSFQSTYATKGYYYRQELNLDYSKYTGYNGLYLAESAAKPYRQAPIGRTDAAAFAGTYDGGSKTISGVLCSFDGTTTERGGLFGSSKGTLKNIVYDMGGIQRTVTAKEGAYFGGLLGCNYSGTVQDCTVKRVNMTTSVQGISIGGLIGYSGGGTIQRCGSETVTLESSGASANVGGLVGSSAGAVTSSSANIPSRLSAANGASAKIGGLIGSSTNTVQDCTATVKELSASSSGANAGGLIGSSTGAVKGSSAGKCSATVTILTNNGGDAKVGGLVGSITGTGTVTNCKATVPTLTTTGAGAKVGGLAGVSAGAVKGCTTTVTTLGNTGESANIGGLVGENTGTVTGTVTVTVTVNAANRVGTFTETGGGSNTVTVAKITNSGKQAKIGGLVGHNTGAIESCSARTTDNLISEAGLSGAVQTYVGGLVGWNIAGATIKKCRATVNSMSSDKTVQAYNIFVGGLVGENIGTVEQSVAQVTTINGKGNFFRVGGLVGENNGKITTCMSDVGSLTGTGSDNRVGGLVGTHNGLGSEVNSCYSKVGTMKGDGSGGNVSLGGLVGYHGNGDNLTSRIKDSWTTVTTMNAVNVTVSNKAASVGGLVGWEGPSGVIQNCSAQVTTISSSNVNKRYFGNWVGSNNKGAVSGCTATVTNPSDLRNYGYNA